MGSLFKVEKPDPMPEPPRPPDPAKTDITDDGLEQARRRIKSEAARRGRSSLRIPLAGASGGSGVAVNK